MSTAAVVETKIDDDVVGQASKLATAMGNSGKNPNIFPHVSNSKQIIDYGATDYIICDSKQVSNLT